MGANGSNGSVTVTYLWTGGTSGAPATLQSSSVVTFGSQMQVFGKDASGAGWSDVYTPSNGTWSGWQSLGGNLAGNPAAAQYQTSQYGDQMEVYGRAANGQAYSDVWTPSTGKWSGWYAMGGTLAGDPTAVQYGTQMELFARDTSGATDSNVYTPSTGKWSGWYSLGGNLTG